jgi:hypothetical protein
MRGHPSSDNGLVIHAEKCVWGVQELEDLGHKISVAGMLPLPSHVAAVQDFPRPTIIKELQAFLGMVNFYRWFLPIIARTVYNLNGTGRQPHAIFACDWRPVHCKTASFLKACCQNNYLNQKTRSH